MPISIKRFEYMAVASFCWTLLVAIGLALYDATVFGDPKVWIVQGAACALLAALVLLASRGRRAWAKWVLVAFFAVGVPMSIYEWLVILPFLPLLVCAGVLSMTLQAVALSFLFRPNAEAFLGSRRQAASP